MCADTEAGSRSWFCRETGRGFPLVLLHGFGASGFSWRGNLGPLSSHYQVLALDLPAHGRTSPFALPDYRLETLNHGLLSQLDLHGLDRSVLIGNSLGGGLALLLARDHPRRFPALVLLAPAIAVPRLPWFFLLLRLPLLGWAAALLLGPWTPRLVLPFIYQRHELITPEVIAGYAPTFRHLANRLALRRLVCVLDPWPLPRVEALLSRVRQPLCLIWGEHDRILPPNQAYWLKDHLPQAELHVLSGVGHAPQEEAPDRVNEIIIAFLARSLKN